MKVGKFIEKLRAGTGQKDAAIGNRMTHKEARFSCKIECGENAGNADDETPGYINEKFLAHA